MRPAAPIRTADHLRTDFRRRLRAADVESAIELDGVEVDDLAAGCLSETDRKYILSKYKIKKLSYLEHLVAQIVGVEIPFNNLVVSLTKFD